MSQQLGGIFLRPRVKVGRQLWLENDPSVGLGKISHSSHVLLGELEVENVEVLFQTFRASRLGQGGEAIVLGHPPQSELGGASRMSAIE